MTETHISDGQPEKPIETRRSGQVLYLGDDLGSTVWREANEEKQLVRAVW